MGNPDNFKVDLGKVARRTGTLAESWIGVVSEDSELLVEVPLQRDQNVKALVASDSLPDSAKLVSVLNPLWLSVHFEVANHIKRALVVHC